MIIDTTQTKMDSHAELVKFYEDHLDSIFEESFKRAREELQMRFNFPAIFPLPLEENN